MNQGVFFGQMVIGPAGSGKVNRPIPQSTFCKHMQEIAETLRRNIIVVNLDPAAEHSDYKCDIGNSDPMQIFRSSLLWMMSWRKWNQDQTEPCYFASTTSSRTRNGSPSSWMKSSGRMTMLFSIALVRFSSTAIKLFLEKQSSFYNNTVLLRISRFFFSIHVYDRRQLCGGQ